MAADEKDPLLTAIEAGSHMLGLTIDPAWIPSVRANLEDLKLEASVHRRDALAYIPFVWMITEAKRCGLKFKSAEAQPPAPPADPDTFRNAISQRDKDGRIYDPRAGLGASSSSSSRR